jgi:hypothetical protein
MIPVVTRGRSEAAGVLSHKPAGEAVIGRLLQDELKSLAAGARKAAEYYRANPDKISRDADLRGPDRRDRYGRSNRGVGTMTKHSLICVAIFMVGLLAPARAAELPWEMIGEWCSDREKTLEVEKTLEAGVFYHARTSDLDECGNRGGFNITKRGLSRLPLWPPVQLHVR